MSEQDSASRGFLSRRDFLKLLGAGGAGLAFAPFVPWGNFMPNPKNDSLGKVQVMLPGGVPANIKTFPVNHSEVITYPSTGDRVLDEEAFRKWNLIRLPEELGGANQDVSAFECIAWCAFTCGASGHMFLQRILPNHTTRESARVMAACMIR